MTGILVLWIETLLRWFHVIAGISWIGASFYFVHLDFSLKPRDGLPKGTAGEAWQVHGGGFYHMMKYLVAPAQMPAELTWFKWESYATWISGILLLGLVYYLHSELYLIDPAVARLTPIAAVAISAGGLLLGWISYDTMCRSRLGESGAALGIAGFGFLTAVFYGFTQVLSARGAFMEMGALMGTIMAANVFAVIIPGQRVVVADLIAGRAPDPKIGKRGKQRSLHNNYLTLPVVFVMLGVHAPLAFASRWNWLILSLVLVIGAAVRHFFNTQHKGLPRPWWTWGVAALCMIAIVWLSLPEAAAAGAVSNDGAEEIVMTRCAMCHAQMPVWPALAAAPRGLRLDAPDAIHAHRAQIRLWAVETHAMPPANLSEITPEERARLAQWTANDH